MEETGIGGVMDGILDGETVGSIVSVGDADGCLVGDAEGEGVGIND